MSNAWMQASATTILLTSPTSLSPANPDKNSIKRRIMWKRRDIRTVGCKQGIQNIRGIATFSNGKIDVIVSQKILLEKDSLIEKDYVII